MCGEDIGAFVQGCERLMVGWLVFIKFALWSLGGEWVMGAKVEARIEHHSKGSEDAVFRLWSWPWRRGKWAEGRARGT